MKLIETRTINLVPVNGYYDNGEAWFSRNQIGSALEYSEPELAILKIHSRHKERLDKFSFPYQFDTPKGKREGYVYNIRGVFEICRWSRQPKADMVMDALYDMAESVMKKGYTSAIPTKELFELLRKELGYDRFIEESVIPLLYEQKEFTPLKLIEHMAGFEIKTKEDFDDAVKVLSENKEDKERRTSTYCHCITDLTFDPDWAKAVELAHWEHCYYDEHCIKINGKIWFDDEMLTDIKYVMEHVPENRKSIPLHKCFAMDESYKRRHYGN